MDHDEKVYRPPSDDDVQAATPPVADGESFGVNERALIRKLDYTLLPAVTVLYLMSFLDRSNGPHIELDNPCGMAANCNLVANARVEGLVTDVKMSRWCPWEIVKQC